MSHESKIEFEIIELPVVLSTSDELFALSKQMSERAFARTHQLPVVFLLLTNRSLRTYMPRASSVILAQPLGEYSPITKPYIYDGVRQIAGDSQATAVVSVSEMWVSYMPTDQPIDLSAIRRPSDDPLRKEVVGVTLASKNIAVCAYAPIIREGDSGDSDGRRRKQPTLGEWTNLGSVMGGGGAGDLLDLLPNNEQENEQEPSARRYQPN